MVYLCSCFVYFSLFASYVKIRLTDYSLSLYLIIQKHDTIYPLLTKVPILKQISQNWDQKKPFFCDNKQGEGNSWRCWERRLQLNTVREEIISPVQQSLQRL